MTDRKPTSEKLRWLLLEGTAIVVSILLAFAIDAWWDGRNSRLEEQEILVGLAVEFVDLAERLERWAKVNREGVDRIDEFLAGPAADLDIRSIETVFLFATLVNVLDQGGAVEALLESGRLEHLADRELRARLVKWPDLMDDIRINDLSARDFAMREIAPYLARHGFPRTVCPPGAFYICDDSGPVPPEYIELADDRQFRAYLITRRGWMNSIARDHEQVLAEARKVLEIIRSRLAVPEPDREQSSGTQSTGDP